MAVALPRGRYAAVAVDPPWDIGARTVPLSGRPNDRWRELPYKTMALQDIGLPVRATLLADAWVFLWCPTRLAEAALSVMRAWRVRPHDWLVWHKVDGGPQMPGQWRHDAEFVLVGKHGSPRWLGLRRFHAVHRAPRERRTDPCRCERTGVRKCTSCPPRFLHSAKPPSWYAEMAARTPGPRLDMFARRRHPGWDVWGDEAPA